VLERVAVKVNIDLKLKHPMSLAPGEVKGLTQELAARVQTKSGQHLKLTNPRTNIESHHRSLSIYHLYLRQRPYRRMSLMRIKYLGPTAHHYFGSPVTLQPQFTTTLTQLV
jgi:hypothetical protein